MLIFFDPSLVFLAVPKTGTTAIELALKGKADIIFSKGRKHINAQRYRNKIAPFLGDVFGQKPRTMAVMREPLDQLSSWYRYRARLEPSNPNSTKAISFDQFVLDVLQDDPPQHARVGSQFGFVTSGKGKVLVDHLFAYERADTLHAFLRDHFGAFSLSETNVSPKMKVSLSAEVEAELRRKRADDFALHDQIMAAQGHLSS
ncbi:hypothetical protein [Nereida sp. MMG025]|uniref:hypothetical protein n=1 Tax=Nereida sp. MMG025 TaxID=2909981 RepID=UPI001F40D28A|nr:hypothetical protein [Nereida sp. MMG025]MCF6445635.1 hypothetical protein [Nereida sp. MMG025]